MQSTSRAKLHQTRHHASQVPPVVREMPAKPSRAAHEAQRHASWMPTLKRIDEASGIEVEIGALRVDLLRKAFGPGFHADVAKVSESIVSNILDLDDPEAELPLFASLASKLREICDQIQTEQLQIQLLIPALNRLPATQQRDRLLRSWEDRLIQDEPASDRRVSAPVVPANARSGLTRFLPRSLSESKMMR